MADPEYELTPKGTEKVHPTWKWLAITALGLVILMAGAWARESANDRILIREKVELLNLSKLDRTEFHTYRQNVDLTLANIELKLDALNTNVALLVDRAATNRSPRKGGGLATGGE